MKMKIREYLASNGDLIRITLSFKGKNQSPLLMIIKEYWQDNKVIYAEVLWQI